MKIQDLQTALASIWLTHNGILHQLSLTVTADCQDDGILITDKNLSACRYSPQTSEWLESLTDVERIQLEDICMLHACTGDNLYIKKDIRWNYRPLCFEESLFKIETESTDGDMGKGIWDKAEG